MEILNAQITDTQLGYAESGVFTFWLVLDLQDGGGVSIGGYAMDEYDKIMKDRIGTAYGMNLIKRILEVVGVRTWEDLKGKYIRVESGGLGSRVTKIGNLMKDEWVNFTKYGKEFIK